MPLLNVNATATGLSLHATSWRADTRIYDLARGPGPVILMVHGYKYAPESARHCPHHKIFRAGNGAWPAGLGFDGQTPQEGLGIAFGWYARGPLSKVHRRARHLGWHLARVIRMLHKAQADRPIHLIGHSLGVEVVLNALPNVPAASVDRIILLSGASYQSDALKMLASPAGRGAEVLNVVSRENDVFDAVFERLVRRPTLADRAIGAGLDAPNVVNLQIDCDASLRALASLSRGIAPAQKRICHWSSYRRAGLMTLYREFLRCPSSLAPDHLRQVLPDQLEPRWSRLVPKLAGVPSLCRPILHPARLELGFAQRRTAPAPAGSTHHDHAY